MDGIQNILKAISKNIGRDLTKDTDSIKIKSISTLKKTGIS